MKGELNEDYELIFTFKNKKTYSAFFLYETLINKSEKLEMLKLFKIMNIGDN